ncbi:PCYCGC motif-containing (lipo)protein [Brevibacillus ginsengisoli]|uniref:PCYCGC motif-containing (lipo)protein n=1 Tax=Brevibacillus ginsengisoli TaxID=363854 RepID=UPI003CF0A0A0
MKPVRPLYLFLFSLFLILAGCGTPGNQSSTSHDTHQNTSQPGHQQHAPNGDLQETTASIKQLPNFLNTVDPQIKEVYRIAGDNLDVLKWMPCYCGCADSAGHEHNAHCFVKEVQADGSVVWDDHGTRCGTCMEIAAISAKMKQEGKSLKEIRNTIDDQYKTGYSKPTPTPMPE